MRDISMDSRRIVSYLFRLHVPPHFAAHQHRDQPEMAGNGRMMRRFRRRDGRLRDFTQSMKLR